MGSDAPAVERRAALVRPMRTRDLDAVVRVKALAFDEPSPDQQTAQRSRLQALHLLAGDAGGSFVAERDRRVVGAAQAMRRESLWCLSLLAVDPSAQSSGAGGALMQRALTYARAGDAGLIVASDDPRARRLYGQAGFALRPTFQTEGTLVRSALPRPDPQVRAVERDELHALAPISRALRGATHTRELQLASAFGVRVLALADRGFAAAVPGWGVWMLAARDEEAASTLLWHALELAGESERPAIRWLTAEQDWAVRVALRAGYRLTRYGALGVRGRPGPLAPYLPSGPFA